MTETRRFIQREYRPVAVQSANFRVNGLLHVKFDLAVQGVAGNRIKQSEAIFTVADSKSGRMNFIDKGGNFE